MDLQKLLHQVTDGAQMSGIAIAEQIVIDPVDGENAPIPAELNSTVYEHLVAVYPLGIYKHQSQAIQAVLDGNDVCLATPTASGKSLIFMAAAADLVLRDPRATVLCLYPIKALI